MKNIVIIGNGVAGATAARHIRKLSDHAITMISAETDYFFARTALMYIYMGHMTYEHTKPYEDFFWPKNKIQLKRDFVNEVDTQQKQLHLASGENLTYDDLIIASGSKPNKIGWEGEGLKGVQGLYSYQDLELMEQNTQGINRAVIVGGGLIGIEMAEMLLTRNIAVTFLVREKNYWANVLPPEESAMITRHAKEHHVEMLTQAELAAIKGDEQQKVKSIITKSGLEIECQFVGLTIGVSPNIKFLEGSNISLGRGIMVNEYFETNTPDVYAIGDCAEFHQHPRGNGKPIDQLWYTARMHGETVARTICGKRTAYKPGPWFNSAKFMDIEYQVYGDVKAQLPENEGTIYWEHNDGRKSIRINYKKDDLSVIGFNLMGIRFRHEVCERWIREGTNVKKVVEQIDKAFFDGEFSKKYKPEVLAAYNDRFPDNPVRVNVVKRLVNNFF